MQNKAKYLNNSLRFTFLITLAFFILIFSDKANAQCNSSIPAANDICKELQRAGRPEKVETFRFTYTNPQKVSITITPKEAFKITEQSSTTGSIYLIEIVNASLLFTARAGGLFEHKRVEITEIKIDGGKGKLEIDADSRCETILEFNQRGVVLDIDDLKREFNIEWVYPSALISSPVISGTQVRVKRLKRGEANLTLVVQEGNIEIARATRPVLDCESLPYSGSSTEGITQVMTPDRCWKPIALRYLITSNISQRVYYEAENVCTRPIRCTWKHFITHYDSIDASRSDTINNNSANSKLTSDENYVSDTVPERSSNGVNGRLSSYWDQESTKRIANEVSNNYWNQFNIATCVWND